MAAVHSGSRSGDVLTEPPAEPKWASLFKPKANIDKDVIFKLDHIDLSAIREGRKLKVPNAIAT